MPANAHRDGSNRGHGPLLRSLTVGSDAERGNYERPLVQSAAEGRTVKPRLRPVLSW